MPICHIISAWSLVSSYRYIWFELFVIDEYPLDFYVNYTHTHVLMSHVVINTYEKWYSCFRCKELLKLFKLQGSSFRLLSSFRGKLNCFFVCSVVFIISACASPFLGFMVDRVGKNVFWGECFYISVKKFSSVWCWLSVIIFWIKWSRFEPWPGTYIVLCSWARRFTPTVPHFIQVYKWVLAN